MDYCADTWFMLLLFQKDREAHSIFRNAQNGKNRITIPLVVFFETTKKMLQQGTSQLLVDEFFEACESSDHIQIQYPDKSIAREAARISLTYAISLMNSFVASTAKLSGCHALLSADSDYKPLAKKGYIKVQAW